MLRQKKKARFTKETKLPFGVIIAIEILAIVVGVMMGFWLNEWREVRKTEEIVENALVNIAREMDYNHRRIEHTFGYYRYINGQIDSLANTIGTAETEKMYGYQISGWQGVQLPLLRSQAWEMALSTGIAKDMDYDMMYDLSSIYNMQSMIQKMDDAIVLKFASDNAFAALGTIRHLFGVYGEMIPELMAYYQTRGKTILNEYGYDQAVRGSILITATERAMEYSDLE